jgi:hypothetical protein
MTTEGFQDDPERSMFLRTINSKYAGTNNATVRKAMIAEWNRVNGSLEDRFNKKMPSPSPSPTPANKPVDPRKIGLAVTTGVNRNK